MLASTLMSFLKEGKHVTQTEEDEIQICIGKKEITEYGFSKSMIWML